MVSKAQAKIVKSSFCRSEGSLREGIPSGDASFPEGIPSEQTTKDLLRSATTWSLWERTPLEMTAISAPRRTIVL